MQDDPGDDEVRMGGTNPVQLPRHRALRYLQPLREGGSLPAVVETDGGLFVTKFRGAGQGAKALVAELVAGLLADSLGLPVPGLAAVELGEGFGDDQEDPEIRDLLQASVGTNVGLTYLDGAFNFDLLAAGDLLPADLASEIVWFDALVTNLDRTARNPNLLVWERAPWLIDHGAALYAHHAWDRVDDARTRTPFPLIEDHVLLAHAADLRVADARLAPRIDAGLLRTVLAAVPDDLLLDTAERDGFEDAEEARARYVTYLELRMRAPRRWVEEAVAARAERLARPPARLEARR